MNELWIVLLTALVLVGCGGDDEETAAPEAAAYECTGETAPAQACCDVTLATADACVRCGFGTAGECGDAVRQAIDQQSFGQGCVGADSIRDEASFDEECLPAMKTWACDDLAAGNAPASCQDQIQFQL